MQPVLLNVSTEVLSKSGLGLHLLAQLVDEYYGAAAFGSVAHNFAHSLAHHPCLKPHYKIQGLPLNPYSKFTVPSKSLRSEIWWAVYFSKLCGR